MTNEEYVARKEAHADDMIDRLEARCFPGLRAAIRYREVRPPQLCAQLYAPMSLCSDATSMLLRA